MNYQRASKQQLLAERARLMTAHRRAEQRLESRMPPAGGGGAPRRPHGSDRTPQREVDQLAAQLARVEAELARRDERAGAAGPAREAPAEASGEASSG